MNNLNRPYMGKMSLICGAVLTAASIFVIAFLQGFATKAGEEAWQWLKRELKNRQ